MGEKGFPPKSSSSRRVVVTGLGILSPVGLGLKENWDNVLNGRSGIRTISQFDASSFGVQIAGEVKNFDPLSLLDKKEQKKMDRFIMLSLAATKEAMEDAGLNLEDNEPLKDRSGVLMGVGIGGLPDIAKQAENLKEKGPQRLSPFFIPAVITNMASGHITIKYGLRGPNYSVTSACASGAHAIGEAARYIREGHCDMMIAGGCESAITPLAVAGFDAMRALSHGNNQPEQASRPFDKDRDGFVLGEGAGSLILEDYEKASLRGASIYGELTGYGASSDAHHMTNPAPGGAGAALAMDRALKDAQLGPEDIGYINAHGTSTPTGDRAETEAIKSLFGTQAQKLWISSTKSVTGHTLGAAGAIESIYSLLSLKHQVAPPTINLDHPSEDCDLDYVPFSARDGEFHHVLSNSFGFGGTNASLVFSKP